jgi:hypothetical protein
MVGASALKGSKKNGTIVKKKELSALRNLVTQKPRLRTPSGRARPVAVGGSLLVRDECRLDLHAVLRWADDGGRWVKESESSALAEAATRETGL